MWTKNFALSAAFVAFGWTFWFGWDTDSPCLALLARLSNRQQQNFAKDEGAMRGCSAAVLVAMLCITGTGCTTRLC
jgi:hypothetical protein